MNNVVLWVVNFNKISKQYDNDFISIPKDIKVHKMCIEHKKDSTIVFTKTLLIKSKK